ncbi:hypothetical protein KAW55_03445, partial [bacterium]|nr:hypothetical protein [bacterium]
MQTLRYKLKWKLEKILLLLFIFTLPIINEELVMEIGFTLYINYIFAVAAGAVFIAKRLKSKRFKFWGSPIDFWLLFFIMAILLSIFQSSFITDISKVPMSTAVSIFTKHPWLRSISQVAAVVFMSFIYYLIINIVDDKRTLKAVLITFILSSTLVCLYSLIDVIMYYSPDNSLLGRLSLPQAISPIVPRGMITASRGLRIRGLMIEPLMLGTYLISIIPVSISLMFGNYWVRRRWLFIVLSIQLGALFFTISRGAWLGLLGALSALIFLNRRAISSQVKMLLRKPCSILIIGLILLSFVLLA